MRNNGSLAKRVNQLENESAVRIALVRDGSMDFSELTDAEVQIIIDETPPEMRALFERLTPEQNELLATTPIAELPDDLRAICEELIFWDRHYFGGGSEAEKGRLQ